MTGRFTERAFLMLVLSALIKACKRGKSLPVNGVAPNKMGPLRGRLELDLA